MGVMLSSSEASLATDTRPFAPLRVTTKNTRPAHGVPLFGNVAENAGSNGDGDDAQYFDGEPPSNCFGHYTSLTTKHIPLKLCNKLKLVIVCLAN